MSSKKSALISNKFSTKEKKKLNKNLSRSFPKNILKFTKTPLFTKNQGLEIVLPQICILNLNKTPYFLKKEFITLRVKRNCRK
jgi:hypothetical protein